MKSLRFAPLLFALLPGCDCRVTKVTYGAPADSDTESELVDLLKKGLAQCAKEGESDTCDSDEDFFDDLKKLEEFKLGESCVAGEQAQVIGVAGFSPGANISLVAGTLSKNWRGKWSLKKIETKHMMPHYRPCSVFGEEWRNEEVTFQSQQDG